MPRAVQEFRKKISEAEVLGCFSKTTDSSVIESIGFAGWDFVIIDMEHGPVTTETVKHHVMAANSSGVCPVVRVEGYDSEAIGKVLDLGAAGIQVPNVTRADHVRQVIEKSKFFPQGRRGVCRFVKAANYGSLDRNDYFKEANTHLLIIQVEGREGIENIAEILDVEGIDILFLGPYDLSQSLGYPGQIEHPVVVAEMQKIVQMAARKGVIVGTFCDTPEQLNFWKKAGVRYLSYSVDLNIFLTALAGIKENLNG